MKLAESVVKEAGIKLEEAKAYEGAGGGGKLKIVPYTVHHLSFGDIHKRRPAVILRWGVPVGKDFWLCPRGHGRPRFLQALCGDL